MLTMRSRFFEHLPKEEILNVLTHGIGLLFFLVAVPLLCYQNFTISQGINNVFGVCSFSLGLLLVYTSSTGYHYFTGNRKVRWRIFDHIAIYFLIGGSYTAYLLRYYNVPEGITLLIIQWCLILLGVFFKLFFTGKLNILSTILYVALGWMVIPIIEPLSKAFPQQIMYWVIAGGVSYSIGVAFYLWESYRYSHSIWHLFVLGGSVCHYIGLYLQY